MIQEDDAKRRRWAAGSTTAVPTFTAVGMDTDLPNILFMVDDTSPIGSLKRSTVCEGGYNKYRDSTDQTIGYIPKIRGLGWIIQIIQHTRDGPPFDASV